MIMPGFPLMKCLYGKLQVSLPRYSLFYAYYIVFLFLYSAHMLLLQYISVYVTPSTSTISRCPDLLRCSCSFFLLFQKQKYSLQKISK